LPVNVASACHVYDVQNIGQINAVIGIDRIYSTYGNIHSVPELKHVIDELFTHS